MQNSYNIKSIEFTITLGKGVFSDGGNSKKIMGLATDVIIEKPGLPQKNSASVKIWGLKYDEMANLTMLSFRPLESLHNTIAIRAGNTDAGLPLIFEGEITSAFADFNSSPNPCMHIEADTGSFPKLIAEPALTLDGEGAIADIFRQFTTSAGYTYQNEGIVGAVKNTWYQGSPIEKALKLARDIACELIIDDGMIITLPIGVARRGSTVLLNKSSGLIGYPTFNQEGITCRSLFNPDLKYGGLIRVESIVPKASGLWRITRLTHIISANSDTSHNFESKIEASYYTQ